MASQNRVFVLDREGRPLMPCHPARARQLLRRGRARVVRRVPFVIRLLDRGHGVTQPVELRIDPGSRETGLALVGRFARGDRVLWAAVLAHRGHVVRQRMRQRKVIRRGRRCRKVRNRAPRFDNRRRPAGWLPPSLRSRVDNVRTWAARLVRWAPVGRADVEVARFDTQRLQDPEIAGVEYQRGTLFGWEVREYLLEKWGRRCAYCGAENVPLEIDHIVPRSRGGTDRVSNLALACRRCNEAKGARDVREFLAGRPERLRRVLAQAQAPLRDAAVVNAARYAIGEALKALGLAVGFWSGARTKRNRTRQGYPKAHWIDAACVGESGAAVRLDPRMRALRIEATGRGRRQVCRTDRHGFPRGAAGRVKRVHGFQTGDLVRLEQPKGRYAGTHVGRLASVRRDGRFDMRAGAGVVTAPWRRFRLLQRADGYSYGEVAA